MRWCLHLVVPVLPAITMSLAACRLHHCRLVSLTPAGLSHADGHGVLQTQVDLLTLDWPPELLALDSCKPIYSGRATGLEYGATLSRNGGTGQQSPLPHVIRSPLGSRQLDMTTGMLGGARADVS